MSWSLGETRILAFKAARGAGMAWGLAEEMSDAVVWLQGRGLPGVSNLCRYLSWYHPSKLLFPKSAEEINENNNIPYCPIIVGTAISDGLIKIPIGVNTDVSLGLLRHPLLLLPFVSAIVPDDYGLYVGNILVSIVLGKEKLKSYLDISDVLLIDEAECFIRPVSNALPNSQFKATPLRLPGCYGGCIAVLNVFANKTYAPATELSRSAGAGADSIDDD